MVDCVRPFIHPYVSTTKCHREQPSRFLTFIFKVKDSNLIEYTGTFILDFLANVDREIITIAIKWPFSWHIYIWPWPILMVNIKVINILPVNISEMVVGQILLLATNRKSHMRFQLTYLFNVSISFCKCFSIYHLLLILYLCNPSAACHL